MAARKIDQEEKDPNASGIGGSMRVKAEYPPMRIPMGTAELNGYSLEQLVHELQGHQIELEAQAEELRKTQLALEDSRDKYLDLYEFAPLGYFTLDDKALIAEVNLTGVTLIGVERRRLIHARFRKFIDPADVESWDRFFIHALNRGDTQSISLTLRKNDGTTFPARLETRRLTSSEGAVTIRIVVSDVSDLWQNEALRQSEEKYHNLYRNSAIGIFHSTFEGRFIDVNPALAHLLGYDSPEDVVTSVTSIPEQVYYEPPCYDDVAAAALEAGGIVSRENRYRRKDGTPWYGKLHLRIIPGREGRPGHYEGFVEDISERCRVEEALRESEERFRLLLQHVPSIAVQGYGMDGTTQYWNKASEHLYGYPSQEALGKNLVDLIIPPEMKGDVRNAITWMAESGQAIPASELSLMRKDESRVPVFSSHAIVTKAGGEKELFCLDIDLTDLKNVDAALRESEEKYRTLVESMAVGVFYQRADGTLIDVNPAALTIFSLTREEFLARDSYDSRWKVVSETGEPLSAEQHPSLIALRTGKPVRDAIFGVYNPGREEFTWVSLNAEPQFRPGNTAPYQVFVTMSDITDRKHAQEALHASARYSRSLIEASLDPLVTISPEGRITDANVATEQATGYSRTHLIGTDFSDYFTDPAGAKEGYRRVFENGTVLDYPLEIRRRDGVIIPVLYNASLFRDESGKVQGVFAAARNITERRRGEEALWLANKKLTLLSGITRHDISNQLLTLNGFLEFLHRKVNDPALEEYFTKISGASSRIAAMIQFTREYDSIGVKAPMWQDCSRLISVMAKQAPLGTIRVDNALPPGSEVFADTLIARVFYNLMDNAARYGGKCTTIRFSVDDRDGDPILVCEDDGDGIAAEIKERIFERGFGKNTGMGLFLSREILAITGITLAETGLPGTGARFEMKVPKGAYRKPDENNVQQQVNHH